MTVDQTIHQTVFHLYLSSLCFSLLLCSPYLFLSDHTVLQQHFVSQTAEATQASYTSLWNWNRTCLHRCKKQFTFSYRPCIHLVAAPTTVCPWGIYDARAHESTIYPKHPSTLYTFCLWLERGDLWLPSFYFSLFSFHLLFNSVVTEHRSTGPRLLLALSPCCLACCLYLYLYQYLYANVYVCCVRKQWYLCLP